MKNQQNPDFQAFSNNTSNDFACLIQEVEQQHDLYREKLLINNIEYREHKKFMKSLREERV
ncbi:MAG: hypothetical protein ACXWT0_01850 [Methylobacter sp.]